MIDDERELRRQLREVAASFHVPATPLRGATARPKHLLRTASVAAVLVAAVLIGRGLSSWRAAAPTDTTAAGTACSVTPITPLHPTNRNFPDPYELVIGGHLATGPFNLFAPDHYWYVRDAEPRPAIVLRAERLDASAQVVTIAATGYYLGDGFPVGWSRNWYYRTSVISEPLPSVGCWRISLEDDPQSAVVYYLKLQDRRGIAVPAPTSTQTAVASAVATARPELPLAIESCGSVANVTADGGQLRVDIVANGVRTQYNLQNQFAYPKDSAAGQADVIRAAQDVLYRLMLRGRQVAPANDLPNTVQLRDFMASKVVRCGTVASVEPKPNAFVLPLGCGYVGSPTVGAEQTEWRFDCGEGANRTARDALAYSLTTQGWTNCSFGLATASWAKGAARLGIAEGAGGPDGYPRLTQPVQPGAPTGCP